MGGLWVVISTVIISPLTWVISVAILVITTLNPRPYTLHPNLLITAP